MPAADWQRADYCQELQLVRGGEYIAASGCGARDIQAEPATSLKFFHLAVVRSDSIPEIKTPTAPKQGGGHGLTKLQYYFGSTPHTSVPFTYTVIVALGL